MTTINQFTQSSYAQYLQEQLQKMTTFMLYQKKQNQKYKLLTQVIDKQNDKIKSLTDKLLLMELYQDENNKNQQKIFQSTQKALQLEKRVNKLENTLVQVEKYLNFQHIPVSKITNQNTFQIENKIDKLQKFMMKKVRKIQEAIYQNIDEYTIPVSHKQKQQYSPNMTNYSSNQNSRSQKYHSTINQSKKETKRNQPKVNCFIKQDQTQRPRSPISSYLKKENQYSINNSIQEQMQRNYKRQDRTKYQRSSVQKINKKKKRSRSKSNHSSKNQTQELFINKKIKSVIKKQCTKPKRKQKSKKIQNQSQSKLNNSSFRSTSQKKSKRSKNHSLLSVSQTSIRSTSQQKIFKNQKLYKLRCQIKH